MLAGYVTNVIFCFQESNTFEKFYQHMGSAKGGTNLRFNFYPVIPDVNQVKPGQLRCSAHSDYGAITLLIQDDAGGLEVRIYCEKRCRN